ncbi:MAG TPA: 23S rRNA (guanosine(2251)-2'-O)-methyltransferase RlmB, partial [Nocardioidaceae bacterium]|nr:23S rRNA (guanosine(2251)-2'-O)-methyltransferase RlmB [Nocardioidaceae bacterium]
MAGNSKRQGAIRKRAGGNPTAGSGGRRRKALEGKGPTPKATDRKGHKAHKVNKASSKADAQRRGRSSGRKSTASSEWVAGRNAAVEALAAGVPVITMYVADQTERDDRLRDAFRMAAD